MELVALLYNSTEEARDVRREFARMQKEHLVDLADSVVVYKNEKGHVELDQTVNLTAAGAASGGFWGLLIGLFFSIPLGALLMPLVTAAFGAGVGAVAGALGDYGIDDTMMSEVGERLDQGKAALFLLLRKITLDKVLARLSTRPGQVLQTSFDAELEEKIRTVVEHASRVE